MERMMKPAIVPTIMGTLFLFTSGSEEVKPVGRTTPDVADGAGELLESRSPSSGTV
jgi:hypothetical protein